MVFKEDNYTVYMNGPEISQFLTYDKWSWKKSVYGARDDVEVVKFIRADRPGVGWEHYGAWKQLAANDGGE